jgi:hypothetical protein
MLILTRGQNESIIIDGNIKVTILGTKGQDVKIGERSKGTHALKQRDTRFCLRQKQGLRRLGACISASCNPDL